MRRVAGHVGLDDAFRTHYNTAVTIMFAWFDVLPTKPLNLSHRLESGAIYCVCLIIVVIILSLEQIPVIFLGITVGLSRQVLVSRRSRHCLIETSSPILQNIAPTLTIVRVGLGHNIQDTVTRNLANRGTLSSIAFQPRQPSELREVVQIHSRDLPILCEIPVLFWGETTTHSLSWGGPRNT